MPRKGRDLEKLVRSIESVLKTNPNAKVQSPGFVIDSATGKNREFDVLITYVEGPRTNVTAIECRDRKSRVDSGHVEAFVRKCGDCAINAQVMVSSLGFSKGALKKGQRHNVQCLTLKEAKSIDWIEAKEFTVIKRNLIAMRLDVPEEIGSVENLQVCDKNGNVASPVIFTNYARQLLDQVSSGNEGPGEHIARVRLTSQKHNIYALTADGNVHEMNPLFLVLTYTVDKKMVPLTLHTYTDAASGNDVSKMASFVFDQTDKLKARLMLVEEADGSKSVSLAFE